MRVELVGVRVESAERAEENLPPHPQSGLHLNDLRHLLQLRGQAGFGNCVFSGVAFASALVSAAASLMLCESVSFAACTSDTPLSSVSKLFSAFQRACDAVELVEAFELQRLPRRDRGRLGFHAGSQQTVAGERNKRRECG